MKKTCLALVPLILTPFASAVEFYAADFSVDGQGSTHDSQGDAIEASPIMGTNWSIFWAEPPATDGSTNSFITSGGNLISDDWGGAGSYESAAIDVSTVSSVSITTVGVTTGVATFNSGAEFFTWFYILDGVRTEGLTTIDDGDLSYSASVDVTGVNSMTVGFEFFINGSRDGFEISTVRVDDVVPTALTVSVNPTSASEVDANPVSSGMVTRDGDTAAALDVNLGSSDTSELVVPATVTIAAGQASATFDLTVVDDFDLDGDQEVTVSASAADFVTGSATFNVLDDEVALPPITVSVDPGSFSELGGSATATVSVEEAPAANLELSISISDTGEATAPATVTILSGQTSATVTINGVNDLLSDGIQIVIMTVSDAGNAYEDGSATFNVTDDEQFVVPAIVINELRTDNIGTDTEEYVEIYGATPGYSLTRVSLIVLGDFGANDLTGTVERVYSLAGNTATGKYFVIGNQNMTGATPDLAPGTNIFENNDSLTFMLVSDFTGTLNDDLDADNDGTLDSTPWGTIIDAVSIVEPGSAPDSVGFGYAEGLGFTNIAGEFLTPVHVFRNPDGTGGWVEGPLGAEGEIALDTPGAENSDAIKPPVTVDPEILILTVNGATGAGEMVVTGLGVKTFNIEFTDDLNQASPWTVLAAGYTEADNPDGTVTFSFTDAGVPATGTRFYRIIEVL